MSPWEYRSFRRLTDTIGGSELTVPAQATVTISRFFGLSLSAQLTRTTGVGLSMVEGERETYPVLPMVKNSFRETETVLEPERKSAYDRPG